MLILGNNKAVSSTSHWFVRALSVQLAHDALVSASREDDRYNMGRRLIPPQSADCGFLICLFLIEQ